MTALRASIKAMRPKQWVKNLILFAALVFSRHTFDLDYTLKVVAGFFIFSSLSSCGYLYNDLRDVEEDRQHPTKKDRPIASGDLPVGLAYGLSFALAVGGLSLAYLLRPEFALVAGAYLVLTLTYSTILKHIVIVDVMSLAVAFILRAVAGAVVIDVPISLWFLVCTAFLSLFLAMSKRLGELKLVAGKSGVTRKNLKEYSPEFLQQMLNIVTSGTIMSYALYTIESGQSPYLIGTLPFALYAVFRYQYLVYMKDEGGSPVQTVLRDRATQVNIFFYIVSAILALHWPQG